MKRRALRKQASAAATSTGIHPDLWICLFLFAAVILVYIQVHTHEFINYDDPLYVTENQHVRNGLTWPGVVWAFTTAHDANWIPLTWLSHMLDCQLFGQQSGLHHLASVVLHAIGAVLIFALFNRMTHARWPSAFVAFAFALHPLHVESVAWAAERKDVLSALFFVLTLIVYVIYVERPSTLRYLPVVVLFACALMAKPMAVTLPFVALLLDVWPLKRKNRLPSLLIEKLPLLALSIGSSIITFVVQQGAGTVASVDQIPIQIRLENALVTYVVYFEQFIWPANLAVVYPYSIPATWQWMLAALALAVVTIAVLRERVRRPYLAIGWLWYLGTLVPVIGLVQVGIQSHADRYTYLPLIGISIMLAWGAAEAFRARHTAAAVAAFAVCSVWALITWSNLDYWQNTVSLFQHAIQVTGENYVAFNNLGVAMRRQGRIPDAISNFEIALRIHPQDAELQDNLGESLLAAGRIEEAAPHLSEAVRLRPSVAKAHIDWASALIQSGQPVLAEAQYREALRLDPGSPEAQYGLGGILAMENRIDEARPLLEQALPRVIESVAVNPGDPDGHHNLGRLYAIMGRTNEAIAQFSETARLAPDDADAHYNLGVALTEGNRLTEAADQFSAAIQLRPDHVNAHYSLGKTLVALGRSREAVREFTEALRLQPDFADARRSLNSIKH